MSSEKPPSTLYHYTSQKGLLGIIEKGEIWATDILYLNDAMEYKYAVNLFSEKIEKFKKAYSTVPPFFSSSIESMEEHRRTYPIVPTPPYRYDKEWLEYNMLDDLYVFIQDIEYHIFVFSLSQKRDLLSQWRGYCPYGNGYSIGFETSYFTSNMKDHGLRFIKCEYDEGVQKKMIEDFVDSYINDVKKNIKKLSELRDSRIGLMREYINKFLLIASTLKSKSFEEEEEWRLVTKPLGPSQIIRFREGASTIVPYIPIDITIKGSSPHLTT